MFIKAREHVISINHFPFVNSNSYLPNTNHVHVYKYYFWSAAKTHSWKGSAGTEGLCSCAYNHENILAGNKPQLSLRNKNAQ